MESRRVLIIGITELQEEGIRCVCGFDLDTGKGVRLCPSGSNHSASTRSHLWSESAASSNFSIGQVWELKGHSGIRDAPWQDDFVVDMEDSRVVYSISNDEAYALLQSLRGLARGPLEQLFEGKLLQLRQNPSWTRGQNHQYSTPAREEKKTRARTVDRKKGGCGHPERSIVLWKCDKRLAWWTSGLCFAYEIKWGSYITITPLSLPRCDGQPDTKVQESRCPRDTSRPSKLRSCV